MQTMNVSLTLEQADYVRRTVDRDFGNASEFFRELIREHMQREIDADLAVLEATSSGAPAGPSDAQIAKVIAVQRQVRKELRHAGRV